MASSALAGLAEQVADILFPPSCGACRAPLPALALLCPDCLAQAEPVQGELCDTCGLPLQGGPCPDCPPDGAPRPFARARALYVYSGPVEAALLRTKFGDAPHLAVAAGAALGSALRDGALAPLGARIDRVVPVPVGRARLMQRGYDQVVLLARRLGQEIGQPCDPHLLRRCRDTAPQATLPREQRAANVTGAFSARRSVQGEAILLVDDILTTGCTAAAAAAALRDAGAARVEVATLARVLTSEARSYTHEPHLSLS